MRRAWPLGKPAGRRRDVLAQVIDTGRRGNGAGDRRVGDDELQDELRPVRCADLGGPAGSGSPEPRVSAP